MTDGISEPGAIPAGLWEREGAATGAGGVVRADSYDPASWASSAPVWCRPR